MKVVIFTVHPYILPSQMYFESQPWFRKQNFQNHPDPLVLEAGPFLVTGAMLVHPRAEVSVTVEAA